MREVVGVASKARTSTWTRWETELDQVLTLARHRERNWESSRESKLGRDEKGAPLVVK